MWSSTGMSISRASFPWRHATRHCCRLGLTSAPRRETTQVAVYCRVTKHIAVAVQPLESTGTPLPLKQKWGLRWHEESNSGQHSNERNRVCNQCMQFEILRKVGDGAVENLESHICTNLTNQFFFPEKKMGQKVACTLQSDTKPRPHSRRWQQLTIIHGGITITRWQQSKFSRRLLWFHLVLGHFRRSLFHEMSWDSAPDASATTATSVSGAAPSSLSAHSARNATHLDKSGAESCKILWK